MLFLYTYLCYNFVIGFLATFERMMELNLSDEHRVAKTMQLSSPHFKWSPIHRSNPISLSKSTTFADKKGLFTIFSSLYKGIGYAYPYICLHISHGAPK